MMGTRQELMSVCIRGLEYVHTYIHKTDIDIYSSTINTNIYTYTPPTSEPPFPRRESRSLFEGTEEPYIMLLLLLL